ncbi:non-ribosomal peptide synthetase [Streptomyces viridosporus]|uniref:non-ribosomal peptide synthetase n=1 Tax=Streptomyces viridosporus TaxID=67581 RepID=UPI0009BD3BFC|nr:non-ribosomal peptide synthetase [Streptomyces viridosporus]
MVSTSIQQLFAARVSSTPDAVAVSAPLDGTALTYRRLDERANRLAHRLIGLGVRPGDPVAVLMERSPELVISLLAVAKAGAVCLPLHSAHPLARLQRITDRAGAPVLLTDAALRTRGLPRAGEVVEPATDPAVAASPATDPGVACGPDAVACIIHTSGSTGEPKGVEVTHRGVLAFAADSSWGPAHRRILSLAPYAFGVCAYEIWVPLLNGGRVVLAPPGEPDVATVRRLLADEGITALHVTAGLFRVFAQEAPEIFAPVGEVLTGGDVVSPAAVRRVLDACPDTVVRAMYGATELTAFAAHATMTASCPPDGPVPVGRPMDGVEFRLLGPGLVPVPDGESGELYVAGDRLARGYHRDAALTDERFVADPAGEPGARMYRTGDLMRRTADGLLEFAGRLGDQVKIRGHLVEPGEVEHVLGRQDGVADAAVVARDDVPGEDKRLVAYVVPGPGGVSPDGLRAAVAALLPDYMVPAAFVELDALPLTPNGKLDRAALPAPERPAPAPAPDPDEFTPGRRVLCGLFARALGLDAVGPHDSFFELGGESLQAIRLAGRIGAELGVEVSAADILSHPTVAELETRLRDLNPASL